MPPDKEERRPVTRAPSNCKRLTNLTNELSLAPEGDDGALARPLSEEESSELQRLLDGRRVIFTDDLRLELLFRRDQAGWWRRIAASRRLVPLDDGVVDSVAPNGRRWAA